VKGTTFNFLLAFKIARNSNSQCLPEVAANKFKWIFDRGAERIVVDEEFNSHAKQKFGALPSRLASHSVIPGSSTIVSGWARYSGAARPNFSALG
jgi:hypothetical protein